MDARTSIDRDGGCLRCAGGHGNENRWSEALGTPYRSARWAPPLRTPLGRCPPRTAFPPRPRHGTDGHGSAGTARPGGPTLWNVHAISTLRMVRLELEFEGEGFVHPEDPIRCASLWPITPSNQPTHRIARATGDLGNRFLDELEIAIQREDPDVIITAQGDALVMPALVALGRRCGRKVHLGRDSAPSSQRRGEARTVHSYGRNLRREAHHPLTGRLHIDGSASSSSRRAGYRASSSSHDSRVNHRRRSLGSHQDQ